MLGEVREGQEGGGEGERRFVTTQLSLYRITVLILECVPSTLPSSLPPYYTLLSLPPLGCLLCLE